MADGFRSRGFYSSSNPALQLHLPQTEEERSGSDVLDAIAQIQEKIERIVQDCQSLWEEVTAIKLQMEDIV